MESVGNKGANENLSMHQMKQIEIKSSYLSKTLSENLSSQTDWINISGVVRNTFETIFELIQV
jgi:hypothetical protein